MNTDPAPLTITIDLDRPCRSCGRRGACGNGLCLPCNTARMKAARRSARPSTRYAARRPPWTPGRSARRSRLRAHGQGNPSTARTRRRSARPSRTPPRGPAPGTWKAPARITAPGRSGRPRLPPAAALDVPARPRRSARRPGRAPSTEPAPGIQNGRHPGRLPRARERRPENRRGAHARASLGHARGPARRNAPQRGRPAVSRCVTPQRIFLLRGSGGCVTTRADHGHGPGRQRP